MLIKNSPTIHQNNHLITKKISIMRNLLFFAALFISASLFFSSCQKDDFLEDMEQMEQEALQDMAVAENTDSAAMEKGTTTEEDNEIDLNALSLKDTANVEIAISDKVTTKSGRERIYNTNINLSGGYYTYVYINKHSLDQNCKYIAKITRHSGDPDLYVYGGNGNNALDRKIRRANVFNSGNEEVEATYHDLYSHEGRMFFIVYADQHQYASCKLEIFKDCDNSHGGGGQGNCCSSNVLQQSWMQEFTNCNRACYGKIYCATLDNQSVIYMEAPDNCPDLGHSLYDCNGNFLESWGYFGYNAPTQPSGYFVKGQLLWNPATDCHNSGGGHNNCTPIQTEDFGSYHSGNYIAQSSHKWVTWSNGHGEDARVSHQKDLEMTAHNDLIYKLGNRSGGSYELSFRMKVSGTAHFNIQNSEHSRVGGGVFGATFSNNGTFQVRTNSNGQSNHLNYTRHQWINVKIKFDLHNNRHEVKIGSKTINITSTHNFQSIGSINFYAPQGGSFSIDEIKFSDCNP